MDKSESLDGAKPKRGKRWCGQSSTIAIGCVKEEKDGIGAEC